MSDNTKPNRQYEGMDGVNYDNTKAAPQDPFREHLAQQAENIDQDALRAALTWMGSACAGEGQEAFSARISENVNRLTAAVASHKRDFQAAPQGVASEITVAEIERIYARYDGDMINCARAIERASRALAQTEQAAPRMGAAVTE